MSDTKKASRDRSRSSHDNGSVRRIGVTLVLGVLATAMLLAGTRSYDDGPATVDEVQEVSVRQAAACVTDLNLTHVVAGRATQFLLWVWAKGSNNYLGWLFARTSLQEGPTGTWTMVPQCGGGTTTSSSSTTSTTRPTTTSSTTSTTRPTTTSTTRPTTTTTLPDGGPIYAANCAVCHGADGSGGVGPDLRGVVDEHGVDYVTNVVTNGRGAMPAWRDRLTPAQIAAVVAYVGTFEGGHGHDH